MNELFQWIVGIIKDARFWQIVLPWERAVRVRFGRNPILWESGFHWRIPYFDEIRVANTRLRIACVPAQTITTLDGRTLTIDVSLAFRIRDPLVAMMRLQKPEDSCAGFAQIAVARFIKTRSYAEITLDELEAAVRAEMVELAGDGLAFEYVRVVEFALMRTIRLIQDTWRPHTGEGGL
jgi:regulator of protease activity HflC (stomatin/prohibitin superfamily)